VTRMSMKKKIKKRLVRINAFLVSKKKPTLKNIHQLRLEVKHLEAYVELMAVQNNFDARFAIPDRLNKLFNEAGKLRKVELEIDTIRSVTKNKRLNKPILFLKRLQSSKKKTIKKLIKKRREYPAFRLSNFAKHTEVRLSPETWQQFLAGRASSILELLAKDIMADIRSLHELRKILKSILYVQPLCKKGLKPLRGYLKSHKKFIRFVESNIGSLHDSNSFVTHLEKKYYIIHASEERALMKIKHHWQYEMKKMKEDLQTLLPVIKQFAIDLKNRSAGNTNTVIEMFN
jgi:CHAD domain